MSSKKGVIDLRGKRVGKPAQTPKGQSSLFTPPPRPPERRSSPIRARRRRVRAIKWSIALVLLGAAGWGLHYASYLPAFSIQRIVISGTHDVSAKLVQDYAWTILDNGSYHYISRKNIFTYPSGVLAHAIEGYFPKIQSATISHPSLFSNELDIIVTERSLFAYWCDPNPPAGMSQCYKMDDTGFIYSEAPGVTPAQVASSSAEYVFNGGVGDASSTQLIGNPIGQSFVSAHLPGLVTLLRFLGQANLTPLGVDIQNGQDFTVPFKSGFYMKASFGQDASTLAHNLQLVLSSDALKGKESDIAYVDLRFGDKVYYKLKGQKVVQAQ